MRRVVLLNSYATQSHALWERGMLRHLPAAAERAGDVVEVISVSLPGRHWKWRMHAAALTLVERLLAEGALETPVDAFVVTDMMDLGQFRSALPARHRGVPVVVYFHENQLTFPDHPERPKKEWDRHYAFLNLTSAWLADAVWFNSEYHRSVFLGAIPEFMKAMPTPKLTQPEMHIRSKSSVVPIGIEDAVFDAAESASSRWDEGPPVVVWNHRWEYDKGPRAFFDLLVKVKARGVKFRLAVLGQSFQNVPTAFDEMKVEFAHDLVHWGHVESRKEYLGVLAACDVALVTAHHDFFGVSVLESAAAGLDVVAPNRLAYPEHFGWDSLCLPNEMEAGLVRALSTKKSGRFVGSASHYRWGSVSDRAWLGLLEIWRANGPCDVVD